MEEWKQVVEAYEISNFGHCRRFTNGKYKELKGSLMSSNNKTYKLKYFQLIREGIRINYMFHRLVAEIFLGEIPDGYTIVHIDGNSLNNHVSNLRYISVYQLRKNIVSALATL